MGIDFLSDDDLNRVRQVAHIQQKQLQHTLAVIAKLSAEVDSLRGGSGGELQRRIVELDKLAAEASAQLAAATEAGASGGEKSDAEAKPKRPGHGPSAQPELERVVQQYELDEPDRTCPSCGGQLAPLEGMTESSEMIDVVQLRYRVVQVERLKYGCSCGGCVETAPGPERAVAGGRYSLDFAVDVVINKYLYHAPLERQARKMTAHGLAVSSQTLWDQVYALAKTLEPVHDAIRQSILAQPVVGLDQTGWPNLDKGATKAWQMWAITSPDAVCHVICDDKSAATFVDLVGHYSGTIVCDALGTHAAGAREGPGCIVLAGCWAHILRKFREAEANFPEARTMVDLIGKLYELDQAATTREERVRARAEANGVLEEMKAWMQQSWFPKTTSLGAAIRHTLENWKRLTEFTKSPDIWLDNNITERAFRGPVIGRRNHFGSKSRRGTQAAAILYSLIESAKLVGADPAAYLRDAVWHARRGVALLPRDFAAPTHQRAPA